MALDPSVDRIRVRGKAQNSLGNPGLPPSFFATVARLVNKASHSRIEMLPVGPYDNQTDGTASAAYYWNPLTGDWWADLIDVKDSDLLAAGQTQWGQWGMDDRGVRYYIEPTKDAPTFYGDPVTGAAKAQGSGGIRTVWIDDLVLLSSATAIIGTGGTPREDVEDIVAAMFTGGQQIGILHTYRDDAGLMDSTATGDLPESSAGVRTAAATATDLIGVISEFTGTVSQPLPPAVAGRVLAVRQRTVGLTLNRDGADTILLSDGTSATSLTLPIAGELVYLHCTTAGVWRSYNASKPQAGLDQRGQSLFAPGPRLHTDFTRLADGALPGVGDEGAAFTSYRSTNAAALPPTLAGAKLAGNLPDASGASYLHQVLPSKVRRLGCDFSFGAGANTGSLCLASWVANVNPVTAGAPDAQIHYTTTPTGWSFTVWQGGVNNSLATGTFPTPLAQDGTVHHTEVSVEGNTAYLALADGTVTAVTDARIGAIAGAVACWEFFKSAAGAADVFLHRTWADTAPVPQGHASLGTIARLLRAAGADVQVFTSAGTWLKPQGKTVFDVICIGGGGGGGAGRQGAAASGRGGGGGGAGGGKTATRLRAADLPNAGYSVLVGAGGAGGAATSAADTNGAAGSAGTLSSFAGIVRAAGGTAGSGGTTAGGTAGTLGGGGTFPGAAGGAGGLTTAGSAGTQSGGAASGGGGGGGISAADAAFAGGAGYDNQESAAVTTNAGGANTGGAGGTGPARPNGSGGSGAGGGGANLSGAGGIGGAGGSWGGGAGGGGASLNGSASGAGGKGGDGIVLVVST